jgi:hypothetical protein
MAIKLYSLPEHTQTKVRKILSEIPLSEYYQSYDWGRDNRRTQFRDIVRLECLMIDAAKRNCITRDHLLHIAQWGGHPSSDQIRCRNPISLPLYTDEGYADWVITNPVKGIEILNPQMYYFGKVFQSKLLRFVMPWEFGAIDKRICQVFGRGDPGSQYCELLSLEVEYNGKRWDLKYQQAGWPSEYGTWIQILRMIANEMNQSGTPCPHPELMYEMGLRKKGIWECADVEMAMFSFVSRLLSAV